jgi:hypothetical protein
MMMSLISGRDTAVAFAAAFISAMLFVTAAVGPVPFA